MTAVIPKPGNFTLHAPDAIILKPFGIDALLRLSEQVLLAPDCGDGAGSSL